jgi:AcrR family transcriptional regulator
MLETANVDRNIESNVERPDRRTARREATKAEIVDAAWEIVREQGLGALALRVLANRVGMRAPSLYQYFDSKHAIYDAMFRQGAEAALEMFDEPVDTTDPTAALREMAHRMFEFAVTDPARHQLLFQRTIPGFEPSPEAYAPAVELVDRMSSLFASLGIDDPDALDLYSALVAGLASQQISNDPGGDRWERLVDRNVDMLVKEVTTKRKGRKS